MPFAELIADHPPFAAKQKLKASATGFNPFMQTFYSFPLSNLS
jgi:hypothetical protein